MEWFLFAAPVPGPVELDALGVVSFVAQLVALVPLWLFAREAIGFGAAQPERPQLRVVEGGRELSQRAA